MAHPKRKISKTRRDKRRTHYTATAGVVTNCANCGAAVQHHRVCGECGNYRGKEAVAQEVAV